MNIAGCRREEESRGTSRGTGMQKCSKYIILVAYQSFGRLWAELQQHLH